MLFGAQPWALLLLGAVGCARRPDHPPSAPSAAVAPALGAAALDTQKGAPGLPPVPPAHGKLDLRIVHPVPEDLLPARDSTFIFGSTGTGDARVTVNGHPVRVWPNGTWLGWIPLERDSVIRFRVEARQGREVQTITLNVHRSPAGQSRVRKGNAWIDTLALSPVGSAWWPREEYLPLRAKAAAGSTVRLLLPGGVAVPLLPQPEVQEVPAAVRAFDRDTNNLKVPLRTDRYVGLIRGRGFGQLGPLLGGVDAPDAFAVARSAIGFWPTGLMHDTLQPLLEAVKGRDTVRVAWPLRLALLDTLPAVVELHDDPAAAGPRDGVTVGRALPGGTYFWFFPAGTRAVARARLNAEVRLQLSAGADAWVPVSETRALPLGIPPPTAVVGSTTLTPLRDRVSLRIPVGVRVPYRIVERDRGLALILYGAAGDVDWIRYGRADTLVRRLSWAQTTVDEVTLDVSLSAPVWGYRARWDRNDLILEIRRPPALDRHNPFRGLIIAVDPGHPPGGANGPTGLREAEANLAVALRVRALLEAAGARVVMTRTADLPVELWARGQMATDSNAALLLSIHNNALPDGINPFTNNGTSVFYNHPRSQLLAAAIQRALVARLGLRDLGVARGDLALVRPTWMLSVLSEGLFMMIPDQEAALRSAEGRERYARGVVAGTREFLDAQVRP
ncbi:MAG: N-acetylmuramoyl-L-alanine amidase [Gemmatimonadales bacterium]|nr:N-acetylmuramoyl-L-alanine amidase [Gemmatimonadales bacterium]